jgi:serine/threonine protein kinase
MTKTVGRPIVKVRLSQSGERGYVGRFEIRGVLGRGGMGVVFDAIDTDSRQPVAIKMIEIRHLQLDDLQATERFVHEIKVLERLNHPGVVRMFEYGLADTGEAEHSAFFVMERLRGKTIGHRIGEQKLFDVAEALRVAGSVAESLAYLDGRKVLHRDIKPGNVFMEESGRIVLMDFGLARSEQFTKLTRAGHIVGTVFYMSPERLKGQEADIRSDVFALGIVLYEMLIGVRPHQEDDPTAVLRSIRRGIAWPAHFPKSRHERALVELIEAMAAAEAELRPTPWEISEQCRKILETIGGRPMGFAPMPTLGGETTVQDVKSQPSVIPQPIPVQVGPTWTTSILITIACSLMTFLGGLLVGNPRPPPQPVAIPAEPVPPPPAPPEEVVVEPRKKLEFATAAEAYQYGDERLKAGDHNASIIALEQALNLNPAYADAYRRLGDAHLSAGQLEKARESYRTYKKLRPDAPDAAAIEKLLKSFQ